MHLTPLLLSRVVPSGLWCSPSGSGQLLLHRAVLTPNWPKKSELYPEHADALQPSPSIGQGGHGQQRGLDKPSG